MKIRLIVFIFFSKFLSSTLLASLRYPCMHTIMRNPRRLCPFVWISSSSRDTNVFENSVVLLNCKIFCICSYCFVFLGLPNGLIKSSPNGCRTVLAGLFLFLCERDVKPYDAFCLKWQTSEISQDVTDLNCVRFASKLYIGSKNRVSSFMLSLSFKSAKSICL